MIFIKGKDLRYFIFIFFISLIISDFFIDKNYMFYSELITFLSIIVGFEVTSFLILFNTPFKKNLYDKKIKYYKTELHKLRTFYSSALYFSFLSIIFLLMLGEDFTFELPYLIKEIGKHNLIIPIITVNFYFFSKLINDLFRIFVYPTNS